MWFVVHAVFAFLPRDGIKQDFVVEETMFLVQAESSDKAIETGEAIARLEVVEDATLKQGDRPVEHRYMGIRKAVAVEGPVSATPFIRAAEPIELTYNRYIIQNERDLEKFLKGIDVELVIID